MVGSKRGLRILCAGERIPEFSGFVKHFTQGQEPMPLVCQKGRACLGVFTSAASSGRGFSSV